MPQFDCSNLISSISYNKFNIKSGFWGKYCIDQNIGIVWEKMMKKMKKKEKNQKSSGTQPVPQFPYKNLKITNIASRKRLPA